MTTISYRFKVRGGTAANLATVNEIPLARELVFETDTGKSKLGDGVTAYNALDYTAGEGGSEIELQAGVTHIQWRVVGDPTWIDLIAIADISGTDGIDGVDGDPGPPGGPTIVLNTAGALTLSAATHKGRMLVHDTGTITLPETVAAGFALGDIVEVRRDTAGVVDFDVDGAATMDFNTALYSPEILNQKDTIGLKVIAVNKWAIIGPLADA